MRNVNRKLVKSDWTIRNSLAKSEPLFSYVFIFRFLATLMITKNTFRNEVIVYYCTK